MTLSVIIVNYNVRYFLDQCLQSVWVAAEGIDTEVWVVDNNSVDGSVAMVKNKYPSVHLIANRDNPGFAKANNQALRLATGHYLLLLNPDTVVEPDTFRQCIDFMESHADCGGLGVKMINGEGVYLKESKRGFPTPMTSFFKISGLIHLFPHHKKIAAYYMGNLSDDETHEIDVLPGAYLMVRREALDRIGLLDETFFMYGEDIDFSWRIKQAGYKNYYLPSARIIHYKGESTRKGSMNYVYTFYNAMVIFTKKYFSGGNAKLFIFLIRLAIWGRAALALLRRVAARVAVPLLDFAAAYGGFIVIKNIWANHLASSINYYPPVYTYGVLPLYILVLMAAEWLYGGYEKPFNPWRCIKGIGLGAVCLLVFYSLLDETQRYSRAVILVGSLWTIVSTLTIRGLLSLCGIKSYSLCRNQRQRLLIVGSQSEVERVQHLMTNLGLTPSFIGRVCATDTDEVDNTFFLGTVSQLPELIRFYKINEVLFCGKDLSTHDIVSQMARLRTSGVQYKIVPDESDYIVGANAINSSEDIYSIELNTINTPINRRNKRMFDFTSALILLLLSPILIWFQHNKGGYLHHCVNVLLGRYSWVGYYQDTNEQQGLPPLRPGVFTPADITPNIQAPYGAQLNMRYARNYKVSTDALILWKNLNRIA